MLRTSRRVSASGCAPARPMPRAARAGLARRAGGTAAARRPPSAAPPWSRRCMSWPRDSASRRRSCPPRHAPRGARSTRGSSLRSCRPRRARRPLSRPAGAATPISSAPRRPVELAERIEELERSLWSLATRHLPRLDRQQLSPDLRLLRYRRALCRRPASLAAHDEPARTGPAPPRRAACSAQIGAGAYGLHAPAARAHRAAARRDLGESSTRSRYGRPRRHRARLALLFGNMLYVGGFLFVGEWLFGSIGWGFAQGLLFGIDHRHRRAGPRHRRRARLYAISLRAGGAVRDRAGVRARAQHRLRHGRLRPPSQLAPPLDSAGLDRPPSVARIVVRPILFLILFWRLGGSAARSAASSRCHRWPPARLADRRRAMDVAAGSRFLDHHRPRLLADPSSSPSAGRSIDIEERFARLYPRQSIEAANETKAWLEEQWQTRRPKLGNK